MKFWLHAIGPFLIFSLFILFRVTPALTFDLPTLPQTITLGIGQQFVLPKDQVEQVSIANPRIAEARLTPNQNQILITTLAPGNTDLIVWDQKGKKRIFSIRVIGGSIQEHAKEIQDLLANIEGVHIRIVGERVVLEGLAWRPEDLKKISQIATLYPNTSNLVELSNEVQPLLRDEINRKLLEFGFATLEAKVIGKDIFLTGSTRLEELKQQVFLISQEYYPDIKNLVLIDNFSQPSIELRLTLMEINRNHIRDLGVRWQEALLAVGQVKLSTDGSSFGLASNPTAILDLIERKGWGRILTQPRLVCRSGEKSEFHAGGEIPIRLVSERTADVTFKPYGIILKMSPLALHQGDISLTVATEVSTVDGSNSVDGVPAFLTRKVMTSASLANGESLILAGLMDQNDLKTLTKLPLFASIPLLGELFKSRHFRTGNSDLLVFIQPQMVSPLNAAHKKEIQNFQNLHRERQKWFQTRWTD